MSLPTAEPYSKVNQANPASSPQKVHRYLCPGCSADLVFEPRDGCLSCPYCGRSELIPADAAAVQERSYEEYLKLRPEQLAPISADALEVQCGGCGTIVSFSPPEVAGDCPFCAAKIVAEPRVAHPMLAPEGVLPFRITQRQAADAIKAWLASRWFAPNALVQLARQELAGSVYLPFWTYDAYTVSHYSGERGEYYWEAESYVDTDSQGRRVTRTRQVRRTRWYPASGTVTRWFDDILIAATQSVSRERLSKLEPWDVAELKPYQPAYLAGHKAQRYQLELGDGFEQAKAIMEPLIESDARRDIGGDEQRVNQIATAYSAITFKHLLLPVWISAYRFQDKVFQVLVNARTGEVQGERPYSPWKIAGFVVLLVLVGLVLFYLSEQ
jgi:ribosomal protein S27E